MVELVAEVRRLSGEVRELRAAVADRERPSSDPERVPAAVPRILLGRRDAAHALGMSTDTFAQLVAPHVGCVRRGTGGRGGGRAMRLYRLDDLDAWAAANATKMADDLPPRPPGA